MGSVASVSTNGSWVTRIEPLPRYISQSGDQVDGIGLLVQIVALDQREEVAAVGCTVEALGDEMVGVPHGEVHVLQTAHQGVVGSRTKP